MLTDRQYLRWALRAMAACGLLGGIIGWLTCGDIDPEV